jgi:DNA helicase-2/ATP-dependent DNA helicase PcrA
VLEKTGYQQSLRAQNTAEADARLENLAEFVGSIEEYELEAEQGERQPALDEYLERVALVSDVDSVNEGAAVLLMTVHSAKGLEFDTVLLTGMEDETFPYRGLQSESNDELEEERRLAYVAITRARQRLYISHAATRTIFGQTRYLAPSRFLAQLPQEVVEQRGLAPLHSRIFGAAAIGRQAEAQAQAAEEAWDQRVPERSAPLRSRTASPSADRVVDYSAFDDVPDDSDGAIQLRRGMHVYHRRFGNGIVEHCEGPDKVVARFKGYGPKKVLSAYLMPPSSAESSEA